MNSLVNSNFNRTYNPSGRENALSDIKRLLTSRDTTAQNKACGYLIEVINRYSKNSSERARTVEYLLDNDITVFLCEATSNLDFELFRSILYCLRLVWYSPRFFAEEHAAHAMSAVVRALTHYAGSGLNSAVDACISFLESLLNGIANNKTTSSLSRQSAYSATQLLACLNTLFPHINTNFNTILSSALLLHALVSYQPDNLSIAGSTAAVLVDVLKKWFVLLTSGLTHSMLIGNGMAGMIYVIVCQIGMDGLRLTKLLNIGEQKTDFVQTILTDEHETNMLKQTAIDLRSSIQQVILELVGLTKDHQNEITNEEYAIFLKFLLIFFYDNVNSEILPEFCDVLYFKGYLTMLPEVQIVRDDTLVRKTSTLVLGEMLKVLADKYLNVSDQRTDTCSKDIHMDLVDLQYGIEKPQNMGIQLQQGQPYSLLIYIYFHCQSSENPEQATALLLPHLVEFMLRLPKSYKPPPYIIKALWLVFAMSTISNGTLESLDERVYLEKATDRIVTMLHPEPSVYYTHNPALLLWAFTSQRIPNYIKLIVLSQWLQVEDSLPTELTTSPIVWELLLNIIIQNNNKTIVDNCMEALQLCMDEGDDNSKQEFASLVWSMLPTVLSKALIDNNNCVDSNISYLLDISTTLLPLEVDQMACLKIAVLITAIFVKCDQELTGDIEAKNHFQYISLKLSLYLLGLAHNQNDNRVLLTYTNRAGFLPSVLSATNSSDEAVACSAFQLLSYIVHYFTKNNCQPKSVLQIQTNQIIQSLRRDSSSKRGTSVLQLVYMVLNSGASTPLTLSYEVVDEPAVNKQYNALRALMLRIQLMLCCRETKNQTSAGWKTLSSIFKHAIVSKNDTKLVATLSSQPWTHILIQFQITQNITEEFLTFLHNWLTLLKITITKSQEEKRTHMCKQSLVIKSLVLMKRNLIVDDEMKELNQKTLMIVKDILDESGAMKCK